MELKNLNSANPDKIGNLRAFCDELTVKLSCVQKELYDIRKSIIDAQYFIDRL